MILLDGKAVSAAIRSEIREECAGLIEKAGRRPGLAVILVGEDPASQVYVRNKEKDCEEAGFYSEGYRLPASTTQAELEKLIDDLNGREDIDGILLQLPVPEGLDSNRCLERISPLKDVDGFHPENVGRTALGLRSFKPCTPFGVMALLKRYSLSPAGKKAVVIGRSNIVGRPLSIMLSAAHDFGDATVTLCHSKTPGLREICLEADFIFLAIGRPGFLTADMVKPGAVVVDVGITRTPEGLKGDCDFAAVSGKTAAITPVPGGVGPMTRAMLLTNTLLAFKLHTGLLR